MPLAWKSSFRGAVRRERLCVLRSYPVKGEKASELANVDFARKRLLENDEIGFLLSSCCLGVLTIFLRVDTLSYAPLDQR